MGLSATLGLAAAMKVWPMFWAVEIRATILPPVVSAAGALVEFVVAILLVSRRWRLGAVCALVLGWGFLGFAVYSKATGFSVANCGCFGNLQMSRWRHAAVAAGVALTAAALLVVSPRTAER